MRSSYQVAIAYDLETGGLNKELSNIVEIAMVAVDMRTLEIIDSTSIMIEAWLDLRYLKDAKARSVAKIIFKELAAKDLDPAKPKTKYLQYKGELLLEKKDLHIIESEIVLIQNHLESTDRYILHSTEIEELKKDKYKISEILKKLFDVSYNPQAFEVTKISEKDWKKEGIDRSIAAKKIVEFAKQHTVGNNKPILVGHNIHHYDNPILELFLNNQEIDLYSIVNSDSIDTMKRAKERWFELPNYSLGTCCNEVGITLKEAHRALPDTEATANLFIKMMKYTRGEGAGKTTYVRRKYNFNF